MIAMIGFIVAGIVIGFIARAILPGRQRLGLGMTLLLGVIGSVIGGTIANVLGFVAAVVVSIALLAVGEQRGIGGMGDRDRLNP